jgi:hypothetical protein
VNPIRKRDRRADLLTLQAQAAQSQVAFPIANTLLDLHALAIQHSDFFGEQARCRIRRHD